MVLLAGLQLRSGIETLVAKSDSQRTMINEADLGAFHCQQCYVTSLGVAMPCFNHAAALGIDVQRRLLKMRLNPSHHVRRPSKKPVLFWKRLATTHSNACSWLAAGRMRQSKVGLESGRGRS